VTETGGSLQYDDQLLLGEVVVIWVGSLSGRYLPDAHAQALGAKMMAEACTADAKTVLFAWLVEVGIVDVGYAP
jgi:hypothetical protein